MIGTRLNGPRLPPLRPPARELVVLLHGIGADGQDLISIGAEWQKALPTCGFVAPDAPQPHPSGFGLQWFPLSYEDENERWRGVNAAGPVLRAFLETELARHRLPPQRLALVGFSQGAMLALHVGLRLAAGPAAIVGYSGALIAPQRDPLETLKRELVARPPLLLVHGDSDDVVPTAALLRSAQALAQLDRPTQWHLSPELGHGIDMEGLRHGAAFLAEAFAGPRRNAEYPLDAGRHIVGGASQN